MRLTQSLFTPQQLRLQCFVDDPLGVVRGSALERNAIMAAIMITWETLRCPLSYAKGQQGTAVSWIGGELSINRAGLTARIKDSIIKDIRMILNSFLQHNIIYQRSDVVRG